jgi:vitamin B12 transporter
VAKNNSKTKSNLVFSLVSVLLASQLYAEEALELDDLLVTAGLQPLSVRDVASSITVITREEIEQKQARYLSELLRDVPGFSVSQAGGAGAQTQVRVRGAEANHLLVLIDGIRANDPAANDEFQYQFALTSNIERIEIIRGPQSATWGSDAVAGVINIIRRKDGDGHYLSGNIEAGSFDTVNAGVDGSYAGEVFRIDAGLAYLDTDGINISRSGNEKDGAENTTGNIALEFDAGDAFEFRFSGQVVDANSQYDDIDYFDTGLPIDADRLSKNRHNYLAGQMTFAPTQSAWSGSLSVNRMESDNDNFSDGAWTSATAAETLELRLRGGVLMGPDNNHRLNFALEQEDVDFSQRGEASFYGDPNQDQSYDAYGYALEYVGKPLTGFTWTLSGRYDDYSDFDDAATWQLAASYEFSPSLRLRASAGTGSKTPTFTERYGYYDDLFIGNPDLKPESSQGWEAGIETSWAAHRHQLQLAYFNQDLQDEIDGFVFDPDSFLFTALNKQTDSKRQGVEVIFDTRIGKSLTLGASYTYTDATEQNADGQSVREVRRPRHMASASVNYYFAQDRGNMNLGARYNGSQQDVYFSPLTYTTERVNIDAYTLLDLAASWKLTSALELTGRITNLLDEDYEEVLGFARPGRAVYAGLRGRFDF